MAIVQYKNDCCAHAYAIRSSVWDLKGDVAKYQADLAKARELGFPMQE